MAGGTIVDPRRSRSLSQSRLDRRYVENGEGIARLDSDQESAYQGRALTAGWDAGNSLSRLGGHRVMRFGLVLLLYLLWFTPTAFAEEISQRESANGSRNLRRFTVKNGWELRWDAKADRFSATLYLPNGDPVDSLASQHKPGSGSSFYQKGGTYYRASSPAETGP